MEDAIGRLDRCLQGLAEAARGIGGRGPVPDAAGAGERDVADGPDSGVACSRIGCGGLVEAGRAGAAGGPDTAAGRSGRGGGDGLLIRATCLGRTVASWFTDPY
jgi:hypothetical protein